MRNSHVLLWSLFVAAYVERNDWLDQKDILNLPCYYIYPNAAAFPSIGRWKPLQSAFLFLALALFLLKGGRSRSPSLEQAEAVAFAVAPAVAA